MAQPTGTWRRRPSKYFARFLFDAAAWAIALWFAAFLRYEFDPGSIDHRALAVLLPVVWIAQYGFGRVTGIYRGGWLYGSFEEVAALGRTVLGAAAVCLVADVALGELASADRPVPLSAAVGGSVFALGLAGANRYGWRLVHDRRQRPRWEVGRSRVVVLGAGNSGEQAVRAMLRDPDSPYVPVAFLDDDPDRRNLSILGVPVVGTRADIAAVARRYEADVLLVAVPSADGSLLREIADVVAPLETQLRMLPSVTDMLGTEVELGDIRVPTEADLLGRHQVETNVCEISQYLEGRVVVVTGAGGSIGSELCRQIAKFAPAELIMIDRDESALHAVQLTLEGRALLDSPNLVLLDIRDRARVHQLFQDRRPDVVFHAAALKHLPLLEAHPVEALKTNVWGTSSVLDAAVAAGVSTFVNISTDKAANPTSVLGYSKRIAEGLTADAASSGAGRYLSVRFGNVLGSRGSVLTTFRAQIEGGGPLTVTHPDVTRFFMTVEEAVQLVVQAGALGDPGEVLVLDMGQPVRIADVARRLADLAKVPVPIEFTGLRPGEKLHEELFGDCELDRVARHALIDAVEVPGVARERIRHLEVEVPPAMIVAQLRQVVDEMTSASFRVELTVHPIAGEEPDAFSVPA